MLHYLRIVQKELTSVYMLIERSIGSFQIPIHTKDFPAGTYFAVLRSGNDVVSKQFIVRYK